MDSDKDKIIAKLAEENTKLREQLANAKAVYLQFCEKYDRELAKFNASNQLEC